MSFLLSNAPGCISPGAADEKLIGSWRIDSIYDNHNGFTFTNRNPYPREVYEYRPDRTVVRKGMGEQLEYRYACKDTVLTMANESGATVGEFVILFLTDERLALRKIKKSMFAGRNDVRYEVRYFSKVDSAVPFP